jgi:hypothetical protein
MQRNGQSTVLLLAAMWAAATGLGVAHQAYLIGVGFALGSVALLLFSGALVWLLEVLAMRRGKEHVHAPRRTEFVGHVVGLVLATALYFWVSPRIKACDGTPATDLRDAGIMLASFGACMVGVQLARWSRLRSQSGSKEA